MRVGHACAAGALIGLASFLSLNSTSQARSPEAGRAPTGIETSPPRVREAISEALAEMMAQSGPDALIPVIIEMPQRANRADIDFARQLPKGERRDYIRGLLKPLAENSQRDVLEWLQAEQTAGNTGEHIRPLWLINVIGVELTAEAIERLAQRNDIAAVHYDVPIGPEVFPVEQPGPGAGGGEGGGGDGNVECGVALMGAIEVWNGLGITGQGVVVGVIDTGLCISHPDIANQLWTNPGEIPNNNVDDDGNGFVDDVNGWSFDNNGSSRFINDTNGHGTHVSGTVAGDGTNGTTTGMAPDCQIMTLKFWNSFSGEISVWNSMQYGVNNGADVLTASLGWPHSMNPNRPMWRELCENAMAAGVVVVYAAGNEGSCCGIDSVRTPGDVPDMITAGATDCGDLIAGFSSRGPVTWQNIPPYNDWPHPPGKLKPTVAAPGVDTISLSNNCSGYRSLSGTSMATPHIAGAIALMLEANPDLDHWEVKQILKDTAIDLGAGGPDNTYGAGRVDAYEAVLAALGTGTNVATIVDIGFLRGNLVSGGVAELVASDDQWVVGQSQFAFSSADPLVIDMVVGAESPAASPLLLDLTVEARLNHPSGTVRLRLRNWSNNVFQVVHTYPLGQVEIVKTLADLSATNRVRVTDRRIELSFRASAFASFSIGGFRSFVDQVEILVE